MPNNSVTLPILALVIGLSSSTRAIGQDAIKRLDAYEAQRQSWQAYRDRQQTELNDVAKDLAKTRSDEDVEGKSKAFQDAANTAIKENLSGKDIGGAFEWEFEGGPLLGMADVSGSIYSHLLSVESELIAGGQLLHTKTELLQHGQQLEKIEKDNARLLANISASNQALTIISGEMLKITQGRTYSPTVIAWFRQFVNALNPKVEFHCSTANPNTRCDFVVWDDRPSGLGPAQFSLEKDKSNYLSGSYVGAKYCVVVLPNPNVPPMTYPDCWNHPHPYIYNRIVQASQNE